MKKSILILLLLCPLLLAAQTRKKTTSAKKTTGTTRKFSSSKKKATAKTAVAVSQGTLCDGHYYVDLGLPSGTLWATTNVGADSPEKYGSYFAWGETKPKKQYDWDTYKWCDGADDAQTKYCTSSSHGTVDNKVELEPSDDAAYVNWGSSWRMPTKTQNSELHEKCTWTWTTIGGKKGYKVKSKTNGNSIFLPAAGFRLDSSLNEANSYADYWTRTLYPDYQGGAYTLSFYSDFVNALNYGDRCCGRSVRAVRK